MEGKRNNYSYEELEKKNAYLKGKLEAYERILEDNNLLKRFELSE